MPTTRLVFFLFFLVLAGSLFYLKYGPSKQTTEPLTLTPKQYIERVETKRTDASEHPGEPR
jgi:hypothetical protein